MAYQGESRQMEELLLEIHLRTKNKKVKSPCKDQIILSTTIKSETEKLLSSVLFQLQVLVALSFKISIEKWTCLRGLHIVTF